MSRDMRKKGEPASANAIAANPDRYTFLLQNVAVARIGLRKTELELCTHSADGMNRKWLCDTCRKTLLHEHNLLARAQLRLDVEFLVPFVGEGSEVEQEPAYAMYLKDLMARRLEVLSRSYDKMQLFSWVIALDDLVQGDAYVKWVKTELDRLEITATSAKGKAPPLFQWNGQHCELAALFDELIETGWVRVIDVKGKDSRKELAHRLFSAFQQLGIGGVTEQVFVRYVQERRDDPKRRTAYRPTGRVIWELPDHPDGRPQQRKKGKAKNVAT